VPGCLVGALAAAGLARFAASFLLRGHPTDPAAFAIAAFGLAFIYLCCRIPARAPRARVDPIDRLALRLTQSRHSKRRILSANKVSVILGRLLICK